MASKAITVNAIDPTETSTLRSSFQGEFGTRWRGLRGENREWLAGLSKPYAKSTIQLRYRDYFTTLASNHVLEPLTTTEVKYGNHWTADYVRPAYQKGLEMAAKDLRALGAPEDAITEATRFRATEHQEQLGQEYSSAYLGVEKNVDYARTLVLDSLQHGLENDKPVTWLKDQTNAEIRGKIKNQYKAKANTSIVRTVNEAKLTSFERVGVTDVGVAVERSSPETTTNYFEKPVVMEMRVNAAGEVEWQTAGDDLVCADCAALEGRRLEIAEIRGSPQFQPPIHPNCRCVLVPVAMEVGGETIEVPDSFAA